MCKARDKCLNLYLKVNIFLLVLHIMNKIQKPNLRFVNMHFNQLFMQLPVN